MITTTKTCSLIGVDYNTLQEWYRRGFVIPHVADGRRGKPREWTPMQVVGLAVAAALRNGERSCALSYVGKVYDAFANLSETDLRRMFEQGRTHFVYLYDGHPVLDTPNYDWIDVSEIYKNLKVRLNEQATA